MQKSSRGMRRRDVLAACAAAALPAAHAQQPAPALAWDGRPVKLVVGSTPGGTTDTVARTVGQEMALALGVPVLVDNRPGAGGNIAAEAVSNSPPDGHTLLLSYGSFTINTVIFPKLPFDPVRNFTPVSMLATQTAYLVVHPSLPVNNVAELIAYGKANPGKLSFGIGGLGASLHMATIQFKQETGIDLNSVPYKGTAPALNDLLANQVNAMFIGPGNAQPQIKAGKLRMLATTAPKRLPDLPDLPTVAETLPGFESLAWFALFGPAGIPPEVLRTLNAAAAHALEQPAVKTRFANDSLERVGGPPTVLRDFVARDIAKWKQVSVAIGGKFD